MPDSLPSKARPLLSVIQWIGPPLLGLIGAYGGVTFMLGAWQQRIIAIESYESQLERELTGINNRLDKDQDDMRANYPTRLELQPQFEAIRDQLKEIRVEVNDWRRGR